MRKHVECSKLNEDFSESVIKLGERQICILISCSSMELNLVEEIIVGNSKMRCIAAISSDRSVYFSNGNVWYISSNSENEVFNNRNISASLALYEATNYSLDLPIKYENYIYSGNDLIKIRDKMRNKLMDRHKEMEKRFKHDREDRHIQTEKTKRRPALTNRKNEKKTSTYKQKNEKKALTNRKTKRRPALTNRKKKRRPARTNRKTN